MLHNISILYSFIYFLETCIIGLSYAVMETVKTLYFKIVGSRAYIAVEFTCQYFMYTPSLSCGLRLLDDRSMYNVLDNSQRKENISVSVIKCNSNCF